MNDKNNNIPLSATHLEPNTLNAATRKDEVETPKPPARIHIHSIRKRLTDADGLCAKWLIDECVSSGLLVDDSPAYVKEVSYSQEKGQPEQTIVTISDE